METEDEAPAVTPLDQAAKMAIRDRQLDESDIKRMASQDPTGCIEILKEDWFVKSEVHGSLIEEIIRTLPENSTLLNEATFTQENLSNSISSYIEASKSEREMMYMQERVTRPQYLPPVDPKIAIEADLGMHISTPIRTHDSPSMKLLESEFDTKLRRHTIAHCRVDLRWVDSTGDGDHARAEPDVASVTELVATFRSKGFHNASRQHLLTLMCTPEELSKHIGYTFELRRQAGEVKEEERNEFTQSIEDPETARGATAIRKLDDLALLIFDPQVTAPTLVAGNHHRLAMEQLARDTIPSADVEKLHEYRVNFKPNPTDRGLLMQVLNSRSCGVIIINKDTSSSDTEFARRLREQSPTHSTVVGDGEYWARFIKLWETLTEKGQRAFTSNTDRRNEICSQILGMKFEDKVSIEALCTLAKSAELHDCLRTWTILKANRPPFDFQSTALLSTLGLPVFIDSLLKHLVDEFLRVFGSRNTDNVTANDMKLINSIRVSRSTDYDSRHQPFLPARSVKDLFYPATVDKDPTMITEWHKSRERENDGKWYAHSTYGERWNRPVSIIIPEDRRIRRPGFLQNVNDADYHQAYDYLWRHDDTFLPDEIWSEFAFEYQLPLLARALVVVIWFFNPNAVFPLLSEPKQPPLDLEKTLITAIGWDWSDILKTYTNDQLLDSTFILEKKANQKHLILRLRAALFRAFTEVGRAICQEACVRSGGPGTIEQVAAEWLSDKNFPLHIPGKWIGRMTSSDEQEAITAIRGAPWVKTVIRSLSDILPFESQAVGLGSAIVASWKKTPAINFFKYSKERVDRFRSIEAPFIHFYTSNGRLNPNTVPEAGIEAIGRRAVPYVELVTQCIELEFMVERLIRSNIDKWSHLRKGNDDRFVDHVPVFPKDSNEGPTTKTEWDDLVQDIASHLIKVNDATGETFGNVDFGAFRSPSSNTPEDPDFVFIPDYTSFSEMTDSTILDCLPTRRLGLKSGYSYPTTEGGHEYPELLLDRRVIPNCDGNDVSAYREQVIKIGVQPIRTRKSGSKKAKVDGKSKSSPIAIDTSDSGSASDAPSHRKDNTRHQSTKSQKAKRAGERLVAPGTRVKKRRVSSKAEGSEGSSELDTTVTTDENQDIELEKSSIIEAIMAAIGGDTDDEDDEDEDDELNEDSEKESSSDSDDRGTSPPTAWDLEYEEKQRVRKEALSLTGQTAAAEYTFPAVKPSSGEPAYVPLLRSALRLDTADEANKMKYTSSSCTNSHQRGKVTKSEHSRRQVLIPVFCAAAGMDLPSIKEWNLLQWQNEAIHKRYRPTFDAEGKAIAKGKQVGSTVQEPATAKDKGDGKGVQRRSKRIGSGSTSTNALVVDDGQDSADSDV